MKTHVVCDYNLCLTKNMLCICLKVELFDVTSTFHGWLIDNVINLLKYVNVMSLMMESSSTTSTMIFIL
jgi:hypothetical protein